MMRQCNPKSLSGILLCLVLLPRTLLGTLASSSGGTPSIEWTRPVRGDQYGPGDTVTGEWTTGGGSPVDSPSFKVCAADGSGSISRYGDSGSDDNQGPSDSGSGDHKSDSGDSGTDDSSGDNTSDGDNGNGNEDSGKKSRRRRSGEDSDANCGETVWPTVQETSGSYSVSLAVPNVTAASAYYLEMTDDFGNKMNSPAFSLNPTTQSSISSTASSTVPSSTDSATSTSQPSHTQALDSPTFTPNAPSGSYPDLATAHTPPPIAAFAIPLSIVGAILIAAVLLGILHYRKLKQERTRDAENLKSLSDLDHLSRRSSLLSDTSRKWPDEKFSSCDPGFPNNAREYRYPVPTYADPIPVRPEWTPSSYGWSARREPERRSITRQAFPDDHYTVPNYHNSVRAGHGFPASRTVPASAFRSPHPSPAPYSSNTLHHMMPRPPDLYAQNAAVNHSVLSNYMQPSPTIPHSLWPSSPHTGLPSVTAPLPEPERLFVRTSTPAMQAELARARTGQQHMDVYDRVTSLLYPR